MPTHAVAYPRGFNTSAIVTSPGGRPRAESGNSTRRLPFWEVCIVPLRTGTRPVSSPARLGVQTGAAQ